MREALREALQRDERVFLMGEDVGRYGGCFAVSKGLLDEFGPERIRDTPLSESAFVGAGIGAALGGMRPIVEIMTVNFSLLALDQIVNNAATLLPHVGRPVRRAARDPHGDRRRPPAGRAALAQPRRLVRAHPRASRCWRRRRVEDARGMLWPALQDPDPVLIFEHGSLYNIEGELAADAGPVDIDKRRGAPAGRRRHAWSPTAARLHEALAAAEQLAAEGIERRGDRPAHAAAARRRHDPRPRSRRTHRAVIVDEGWRSGSISAEISARIMEQAFYELDAPVERRVQRRGADAVRASTWRRRRCRSIDRAVVAAARTMRPLVRPA